jgi:hypothetical protein
MRKTAPRLQRRGRCKFFDCELCGELLGGDVSLEWFSQLTGRATPARTRMARLMLRLRVDSGDRILRLSGDEMGAVVGVTLVTVSRIISEIARQGIGAKDGSRVPVTRHFRGDIAALEKIAQAT